MSEGLQLLFGPDPAATFIATLLRVNLATGLAVLIVVGLRAPVRRAHGPATAYQLWWGPLLVGAATPFAGLLGGERHVSALAAHPELARDACVTWALVTVALAALFAFAQARFQARLGDGRAGPAVVGLIAPRIVFPNDMAFTPQERELIRAHEREHVARKDPRAVALVTLMQCLCWFNPLVHLAASLLRLDQELACDAAVIRQRPGERALYARTLLKCQTMTSAGPLACCWMAFGGHPLELRLRQLKRPGAGAAQNAVRAVEGAIRP